MMLFWRVALLTVEVLAHSWVERVMRIEPNGTMTGRPGFARGTVSRLKNGFTDYDMQHQVRGDYNDRMCKATQSFNNYSNEFPALQALPGDFIAVQYQENGHVTLPEITPQKPNSGTVYVYGSSLALEDPSLLSIHGVWKETDSSMGKLLAKRQFDDGQCYQINDGRTSKEREFSFQKNPKPPQGADLWCQCDLRLPIDIEGVYTLYWVWDWPSVNGGKPETEIYTTCLDIFILPGVQTQELKYIQGQDVDISGVEYQMGGV